MKVKKYLLSVIFLGCATAKAAQGLIVQGVQSTPKKRLFYSLINSLPVSEKGVLKNGVYANAVAEIKRECCSESSPLSFVGDIFCTARYKGELTVDGRTIIFVPLACIRPAITPIGKIALPIMAVAGLVMVSRYVHRRFQNRSEGDLS